MGRNGLAMLGYPKLLFFNLFFFGENYGEKDLGRGYRGDFYLCLKQYISPHLHFKLS